MEDLEYKLVNFKKWCLKYEQYKYIEKCVYFTPPQYKFFVILLIGALPFVIFLVIKAHRYVVATLVIFFVDTDPRLFMRSIWII